MRILIFCVLFILTYCVQAYSSPDTLTKFKKEVLNFPKPHSASVILPDTLNLDSSATKKSIADSIALIYIFPNPRRENKFLNALLNKNPFEFGNQRNKPIEAAKDLRAGQIRFSRKPWIIETILGLLLYTALLNLLFNKEIKGVLQSFYNNDILTKVEKDSAGINTWAFIGLFLLFNFSTALVLCEVSTYKNFDMSINGFRLFLTFSFSVCVLFTFKFIVLKFLGLIFDINRLVTQYITIINLTYFNISFLLIAVAICFSLISGALIPYLLYVTIILIAMIFIWQYLGNSVNVLSNYRFHKFYLFIYLCALEISPILILIKAFDI